MTGNGLAQLMAHNKFTIHDVGRQYLVEPDVVIDWLATRDKDLPNVLSASLKLFLEDIPS